MRFGLAFPSSGNYVVAELMKRAAVEAERCGFEVLLVWDHYLLPRSNRTLEAYEALSYLSAVTSKILLGTVVTPIPFRNVRILAKLTSYLDHLSNHRFVLGAGIGWHDPEFRFFSEAKSERKRYEETKKGLILLQKMWTGSSESGLVEIEPRPEGGKIPIWFGTQGRKLLRLCAEIGDGWIPVFIGPEEYEAVASTLKGHLRKSGREKEFTFAVDVDEDRGLQRKSASDFIKVIESYQGAGAQLFVQTWNFDPKDREQFVKKISWYEREVMSAF